MISFWVNVNLAKLGNC